MLFHPQSKGVKAMWIEDPVNYNIINLCNHTIAHDFFLPTGEIWRHWIKPSGKWARVVDVNGSLLPDRHAAVNMGVDVYIYCTQTKKLLSTKFPAEENTLYFVSGAVFRMTPHNNMVIIDQRCVVSKHGKQILIKSLRKPLV